MVLKICPRCGGKLKENAEFCNYCGEDLKERKLNQTRIIYNKKLKRSPRPTTKKIINKRIYADLLYRFFAYLIDMALIYFIDWILFLFVFTTTFVLFYVMLHMIAYLIGFFYFNLLETYNNGQTLGKLIFHIKSVNEETMEVESLQGNIVNNLLKCNWITCIFDFTIGIIKNYGDQKKKVRIMQNISNIVVISSKKKP